MTGIALRTQYVFVYVIINMTGLASAYWLGWVDHDLMAHITNRSRMCALNLEACVAIMVKSRTRPLIRHMTTRALISEMAVVCIVVQMTGDALSWLAVAKQWLGVASTTSFDEAVCTA